MKTGSTTKKKTSKVTGCKDDNGDDCVVFTYLARNGETYYAVNRETDVFSTKEAIMYGTKIKSLHNINYFKSPSPIRSETGLMNFVIAMLAKWEI